MTNINPHSFRLEISKELRELANLLPGELSSICNDMGPLHRASELSGRSRADHFFSYDLDSLIFRLDSAKKKSMPRNLTSIDARLSVSIKGLASNANENGGAVDPLETLEFNIEITGAYIAEGATHRAICSWHLDRNIGLLGQPQTFVHPHYHFQYGGRLLGRDMRVGDLLILDSPRIAHPPMDAILGIDFLLLNFVEESRLQNLRNNGQYQRIMRNAQNRLWRSYMSTLSAAWNPETSASWNSRLLFPQLFSVSSNI